MLVGIPIILRPALRDSRVPRLAVLSVTFILLSAGFVTAATDPPKVLFAVKGVVVDQSGAVISTAEVVFKEESGTIVAHTAMDGSVNVSLKAGSYVVTVSAAGFAPTNLVDFSVPGPTAEAFRVTLKIDQSQINYGSNFGRSSADVPTIASELPNVVPGIPIDQPARPAAAKHRSMRCLYLRKCSASQP